MKVYTDLYADGVYVLAKGVNVHIRYRDKYFYKLNYQVGLIGFQCLGCTKPVLEYVSRDDKYTSYTANIQIRNDRRVLL